MMGVRHIPERMCAICADREATGETEIDGRTYPACASCDSGVVHVEGHQWRTPSRDEILEAIAAQPGVESSTLADELLDADDVDAEDLAAAKKAFSTLIGRMAEDGIIVRDRSGGKRNSRLWIGATPPPRPQVDRARIVRSWSCVDCGTDGQTESMTRVPIRCHVCRKQRKQWLNAEYRKEAA